ncbi:tolB protein precursor, periplasmic protein involved in the tonb-independent uptake of group A colicins, partial [hydrothermal vent metagenome]
FILILITFNVYAVDPRLNWKTVETQNFFIHYAVGYERLAQKTANIAEYVHKKLQVKIHWQPLDKTHLVISDETDSANGFATMLSFSRSVLFMAPPQAATSLEDFDDWLETLITHEYTHILHLDKVSGGAGLLRNIFGRQFLLFPNLYQPNWFIEGLATYYETDASKGIGRGQSSLFQMMMRSEVEQGIKPISQVNLPIRSWPMGTVSYLYGVHFYQFLEDTYGQQSIENLIDNYSDNIIPFMINTNTEHVFDKNVTELWSDFSFWLQKRYQPEVLAQHKAGLVEGKKITDLGYNTSVLDHAYDGRYYIEGYDEFIGNAGIYYIADGAFEHAALMQRINHKTHFVINVHRGAKINTHPEAGVLIIQNEFCDEYNVNSDLYLLANDKSHLKRITECGRYRSASWSADGQSIVAIKTEKGKSQLVLLSTNGELIKTLWSGNNTDIATQLKTSPLGKYLVAAVFRETSGWNIEEFNLENLSWKAITHDHYIDMYPSYSEKGDAILFSSDRLEKGQEKDKVNRYQIYRYVKENAEIQQLTRVKNGAFSPIQNNLKSPLYYVGYHSSGRDIYQL